MPSTTIVIAEHDQGQLSPATFEAVVAAQQLGDPVTAVVAGHEARTVADALAVAALAEVVICDHPRLAHYEPGSQVAALAAVLVDLAPTLVVLPHTYRTRDFAPRLAARLDRPLVADCVGLTRRDGALLFTRPLFQGKVHADVVVDGPPPYLASVQLGAFGREALRRGPAAAPVRVLPVSIDASDGLQRPEPPFREAARSVDLGQADRIVAVGRGIREEAHIALARRLADAVGAELAASRPICDAGWLPMDRQVGSSGQTVTPTLYIALGISGAIQHVVGMRGTKTIVAVNTDPDAPIFEVADYGIVGDLFEVVPALIDALAQP